MRRPQPLSVLAPWRLEEMIVDLRKAADNTVPHFSDAQRQTILGHVYEQIDRLERAVGPVGTSPQPETLRPR